MNWKSSLLQWAVIIGFGVWLWFGHPGLDILNRFRCAPFNGKEVIIFALAVAFYIVDILKFGVSKPFNCIKCMTGWLSLIFAFFSNVDHWVLYLFVGLFAGAMFESFRMRWL